MPSKAEFFEEIDHRPTSHDSEAADDHIVPIARSQLRFGEHVTNHCGWWWCAEQDPSRVNGAALG